MAVKIFGIRWYEFPPVTRKDTKFMLARAQKPLSLNAWCYQLSPTTTTQVIESSNMRAIHCHPFLPLNSVLQSEQKNSRDKINVAATT